MWWGTTRFVPHLIGKTGGMRRRALLFALVTGGLAAAGATAFGPAGTPWRGSPANVAVLARAELAEMPTTASLSRVRDDFGRAHGARGDVAVAFGVALALTLAAGWWIARERVARVHHARVLAARRTRAPPSRLAIVHC